MRTIFVTSVAVAALGFAPVAFAQTSMDGAAPTENVDTVPGSTNSVADKRGDHAMTPEQQTMYDSWPADRQSDYDTWPSEYQVYYWGLEPDYQTGYWALTPDQRTRVYEMTADQQAAAWTSIMQQLNGSPATAVQATPSGGTASAGAAGDTTFVSNEMVQAAPAPRQGEYPVCKGEQQDNCINAWAAGERGAGATRPLDHWPGKPASEM